MSDDKTPTPPKSGCGDSPANGTKIPCLKRYKVISVTISVNLLDTTDNKFIMNNPDRSVEVEAVMTYTITTSPEDLESLPEHIFFSFTDPASDNTDKVSSYEYSGGKFLGKKNIC